MERGKSADMTQNLPTSLPRIYCSELLEEGMGRRRNTRRREWVHPRTRRGHGTRQLVHRSRFVQVWFSHVCESN